MKQFSNMIPYQTKTKKLSGTDYREVNSKILIIFKKIKSKTKRRPYIRSAYFKKQKIFFDYFWDHLWQKSWKERVKRLKYFLCAIELIQKSRQEPISKQNPNKKSEILHRFAGLTKDRELFYTQIKEDKKTEQKYFMSVFPPE
jgi:acyl carrier protein phosphodiesterase